jgi:hypothetical protein
MNLALILQIVNLLNSAEPGFASIITMIRNKDGTMTVPVILDQADKNFDDNMKMAIDWIQHNPAK